MRSTPVALLSFKCPKCHEGALFTDANPFHLKNITKMPEYCACCGQRLELEPGFYIGAMYVSYAISVALFLTNFFVLHIFLGIPSFWFLAFNTFILLILWPVIFRYARTFYLYMFVGFDPLASKIFRDKTEIKH
jgi:uncharacterized protein (DUF983 family)